MKIRAIFVWAVIIVQVAATQPSYSGSNIFLAPPSLVNLGIGDPGEEQTSKITGISDRFLDTVVTEEIRTSQHDVVIRIAQSLVDTYNLMMKYFIPIHSKSDEEREKAIRELQKDIYEYLFASLSEINRNLTNKVIEPEKLKLRLSVEDEEKPYNLITGRKARVGFLPMKGDPWQDGHVWMILDMIARQKCDKIVVMLDNSAPQWKPDLSSLTIREAFFIRLGEA